MVFFAPVIEKNMKKNLGIMNLRFNQRIWPVPSHLFKSSSTVPAIYSPASHTPITPFLQAPPVPLSPSSTLIGESTIQ